MMVQQLHTIPNGNILISILFLNIGKFFWREIMELGYGKTTSSCREILCNIKSPGETNEEKALIHIGNEKYTENSHQLSHGTRN